jgi:hypothetical protein
MRNSATYRSRGFIVEYKSWVLVLLLCGAFWGCVTVKPIVGPDGTEHHLISCGSVEACYERATAHCAGPYRIVNTNSEVSGSVDGGTSTAVKLLVKCGK